MSDLAPVDGWCYRGMVELYTARPVFGYCEILWSLRQILRRWRSGTWKAVRATVEGYEFLAARQSGWLVIFYSYEFAGERYPGELRRWLMVRNAGDLNPANRVTQRFPRGAQIDVRVNPSYPMQSVGWT